MAKLSGSTVSQAALKFADLGDKLISAQKSNEVQSSTVLSNVVGVENYQTPQHHAQRNQTEANIIQAIKAGFAADQTVHGIGAESFTEAQYQAGAMVVMAASNPSAFAKRASSENYGILDESDRDAVLHLNGRAGHMDTGYKSIGMEYFNNTSLDTHMAASFRFNMQAARQDNFSETIMPTIVADPTDAGLLIEIKKTVIHRAVKHATRDADNIPYNRRNILDAATDASLLADNAMAVVPYRLEDGSNKDQFIEEALFAPEVRQVGDYTVPTAPLKFGVKHNLLRLSAHKGLVSSGILDESDELNGRIDLAHLYFTIGKKGGSAADRQLMKVTTTNRPRSTFNKTQEGDGMEMGLVFTGSMFSISGDTKDVDGNPLLAADDLGSQGYRLNFTVDVNNSVNIQTGIEKSMASIVEKVAIIDTDGNKLSTTEGGSGTVAENLEIIAVGYDYQATRSLSNFRVKGLLVDSIAERERYKIQLGSPITSRKPINREDNSEMLEDLITVARTRNSNLCVTKILNVTEILKDVVKTMGTGDAYEIPSIEGVGRHYVRPWYDEANLNVPNLVSTLDTKDVDSNLSSLLLGVIREQVVRAIQESRFQPALEMLSGYTMTAPEVIIGTDVVIANWLERTADPRTLGDRFKFQVVTTNDSRWIGRIQWFFKVGANEGGINPLNFGNHLWIPELITDTNLTRNEGTANELTVQPRNTHIVHCPITGVVNVEGIRELIQSRAPQANVILGQLAPDAGSDGVVGDLVPGTGGAGDAGVGG